MSFFYVTKLENKLGRTGPVEGAGKSKREKELGKELGMVNIVQILCTHVCKWKNDACLNYSSNGGRSPKGEWWIG
jgi:hypothetical protein